MSAKKTSSSQSPKTEASDEGSRDLPPAVGTPWEIVDIALRVAARDGTSQPDIDAAVELLASASRAANVKRYGDYMERRAQEAKAFELGRSIPAFRQQMQITAFLESMKERDEEAARLKEGCPVAAKITEPPANKFPLSQDQFLRILTDNYDRKRRLKFVRDHFEDLLCKEKGSVPKRRDLDKDERWAKWKTGTMQFDLRDFWYWMCELAPFVPRFEEHYPQLKQAGKQRHAYKDAETHRFKSRPASLKKSARSSQAK